MRAPAAAFAHWSLVCACCRVQLDQLESFGLLDRSAESAPSPVCCVYRINAQDVRVFFDHEAAKSTAENKLAETAQEC